MAKSKSFFGLRRGSTKSHTYQVVYGQQITKDRVSSVHNPQTPRQNAQRIVFATVAQAMKFMGPIINHSFEGVPYGGKSLNRFAKLNLDRMRQYSALDFQTQPSYDEARCFMTTKNVSALIPNRYIMSKGSLTLNANSASYVAGQTQTAGKYVYPFNTGNGLEMNENTTLRDVMKALFGLDETGLQLTKCYIINHSGGENNLYVWGGVETVPGTVISSARFVALRLVVSESADLDEVMYGKTFEQVVAAIMAAFDAEKSDARLLKNIELAIDVDQNNVTFSNQTSVIEFLASPTGSFVSAYCDILSKYYNGGWLRSNSEMNLVWTPQPDGNYGLTWYEANKAWAAGAAQNAEAERYLNEGGDENQIGY